MQWSWFLCDFRGVVSAGKGVVTRVGRHALSSRGEGWAGVRLPLRLYTREEVKLVIHVSSLVLGYNIYIRSFVRYIRPTCNDAIRLFKYFGTQLQPYVTFIHYLIIQDMKKMYKRPHMINSHTYVLVDLK